MMDEEMREQQMNNVEHMEAVAENQGDNRTEEHIPESQPSTEKELVPLLEENEAEKYRSHWLDIQTEFVDNPRNSVEKADELVVRVINSITENFASERTSLEDQWNRGKEASTEDLRIAMKRYRSFFNRLLTLESPGTAE
jgi:hypothetical protein